MRESAPSPAELLLANNRCSQWGNLLVLSAAYKDPVLHQFVDEELLKNLFQRTILFFRQSSTETSSLRMDLYILEGLQRDLFHAPDAHPTSSFSSYSGMQTPGGSIASSSMPMSRPAT